jgi:hypothetical protein
LLPEIEYAPIELHATSHPLYVSIARKRIFNRRIVQQAAPAVTEIFNHLSSHTMPVINTSAGPAQQPA